MVGSAARASLQHESRHPQTSAPLMAALGAQSVARTLEQFDRRLLAIIDQHQSLQTQSPEAQARKAANFEALRRAEFRVRRHGGQIRASGCRSTERLQQLI